MEEALQSFLKEQQVSVDECTYIELDGRVRVGDVKLEQLAPFTALRGLSLNYCHIASLENFPKLEELTTLGLSDNLIANGLEALSGLPALTKLDLSGNKITSVDDLEPLAKLPQLQSLDVFKCPVCPAENSTEEMKKFRTSIFGMIKSLKYLNKMDAEGGEEEEEDGEENDWENDADEDGGGFEDDEDFDEEANGDEDDEDEEDEGEDDNDDEDELGTAALVGGHVADDDNDYEEEEAPPSEEVQEDDDDGEDEDEADDQPASKRAKV